MALTCSPLGLEFWASSTGLPGGGVVEMPPSKVVEPYIVRRMASCTRTRAVMSLCQ